MQDKKRASQTSGQLMLLSVGGVGIVTLVFLLSGKGLLSLVFGRVEAGVMSNAYIYFMITALSFPFMAVYNSGASLFRAVGNSQISMRVSLLMNGLNVVGNAICIYGLKMGVEGVAIPTLISRMIAALVIFILMQKREEISIHSWSDLKPQGAMIRRILTIGIPSGIEGSLFQLGKLMLQSLVSTLGTASIAGYAVAGNLVNFLYLPGNALGLGMTTVVGQCVGAREPVQAKEYTKKLILYNYLLLAVIASVLGFGNHLWISGYNLSSEAAGMASGLVVSHCIAMIIWPIAFLLPYAFRAANDVKFTMVISLVSIWLFRVGLAYVFILIFHLSILFVWIAMYIDWVFRVLWFLWRFSRFEERVRKLNLR